jgi:hypothetical protein
MDTPGKINRRLLAQTFVVWMASTLLMACMSGSGDSSLSSIFGSGFIGGTTNQATDPAADADMSGDSPAADIGTSDFAPIGDTVELPVSISKNDETQYLTVPNISMDAVTMEFVAGETSSRFMGLPFIHEAHAQVIPAKDNQQAPVPEETVLETAPALVADVLLATEFLAMDVPAPTTVELTEPGELPEGTVGSFGFVCDAGAIFDPSDPKTMSLEEFELVFMDLESEDVFVTAITQDGACEPIKIPNTYVGADFMISIRPIGDTAVGDFQVGLKVQNKMKIYLTTTPTHKQVYKMAGQAGKTIFVAEDPVDDTFGLYSMRVAGGEIAQNLFSETFKPIRLEVSGSARSIGYQFKDGSLVYSDGFKRRVIVQGKGDLNDFDLTDKYLAYVDTQSVKKSLSKKSGEDGSAKKAILLEPKDVFRTLGKTEHYEPKDVSPSSTQFDAAAGRVILNEAQPQGKKGSDCRTLVKILRVIDQAQLVIDLGYCAAGVNLEFAPNGQLFILTERVDQGGRHRNELHRWTMATNEVKRVWRSKDNFSINDFAVNFSGTTVVLASQEEKSRWQLFTLDVALGLLRQITNDTRATFSKPKFVDDLPFLVAEGKMTDFDGVLHHELFGVYTKTATPVAMSKTVGGTYDPQVIPRSGFILYNAPDEDAIKQIHILDIREYLEAIDSPADPSPPAARGTGEMENDELEEVL